MGILLLAFLVTPASSQSAPGRLSSIRLGVGFAGNAPDALVGASGYVILPNLGGIGFYLDGKLDVEKPTGERGFEGGTTSEEVERSGGLLVRNESSWWSVNVAILKPVSPSLMVYGGGGVAREKVYGLYNVSPASDIGVGGVVWAEAPGKEKDRPNLMVGIMMRLSPRMNTQFGFETHPRGVTVGISLTIPSW